MLKTMRPNGNRFIRSVGRERTLQIFCAEKIGKRWLHRMSASRRLFARYFFVFNQWVPFFLTCLLLLKSY